MEFYQTGYGRKFFEVQFPALIRAIEANTEAMNRQAEAMDRQVQILEEQAAMMGMAMSRIDEMEGDDENPFEEIEREAYVFCGARAADLPVICAQGLLRNAPPKTLSDHPGVYLSNNVRGELAISQEYFSGDEIVVIAIHMADLDPRQMFPAGELDDEYSTMLYRYDGNIQEFRVVVGEELSGMVTTEN